MKRVILLNLIAVAFLALPGCKKNEGALPKDASSATAKHTMVVNGPANGTYKIINGTTFNSPYNRVMEIAGVSLNDGALAQQWDWFPNDGQKWVVTDVGNGYYKIINLHSGKSLDVPGGAATQNLQLWQWPYNGNDAQLWKIVYQGYGVYTITSKVNNLNVTLDQNAVTNGAKITQTTAGGAGQFWLFLDDSLPVDNTVPTNTITWSGTSTKISHAVTNAEYPRVHRVNSTTLLLTYQFGNAANSANTLAVRRSTDNGATWGTPLTFAPPAGYLAYTGAEICVLQNGWVMMAYAGLGNPDDNSHDNVQIRISTDGGITFGAPQIVAYGRSWEPAMVQLSTGEIELFYSSEAAWWPSASPQQQILMTRSTNNGTNWTTPMTVAYTSGMRDGMPVPLVLQNNKGIVFPVESVGNSQSAWMLWSSTYSTWRYADSPGSTANGRRWLATVSGVWGGAPYIVQAANGKTIMSVHDAGGRSVSTWRDNTMIVTIGNTVAKNFTHLSYPWPNLPTNEGAIENSLFMKDATTVMAVSSRIFSDGHGEVYWKQGTIN